MLYNLLKNVVSFCFNLLNLVLGGNLPPFACVCVVVEQQDRFLVVVMPGGGMVFPGGFMRWREDSGQAARRECLEETGLLVRLRNVVSYRSTVSTRFDRISTLTIIYHAEVLEGELRGSVEGEPYWASPAELRKYLLPHQKCIFDDYLRYREQHIGADSVLP